MKRLFIIMAALLAGAPALAHADDTLLAGAKLCTEHFPRYEREYAIPTQLLSAISVTETGRYHDGLKIKVPWPWTINVDGKGHVYNSKEAAVAAVRKFLSRGVQSIDVGCMQVNLQHHPHAFSSLAEAFDPAANVAYAASFLRGLYQQDGSWRKAAADYHSKTPSLGREYVNEVYTSWYQIISKLRAARMTMADYALPEDDAPQRYASATYHRVHMDSITLAHIAPAAGSNVVHDALPVIPAVAVEAPSEVTPLVATAAASAAPAAGAAPANMLPDARKNGPTFIFSD